MEKLKCKRCGHQWYPRKPKKPKVCPKCKSPYWNKIKGWHLKKKREEIFPELDAISYRR